MLFGFTFDRPTKFTDLFPKSKVMPVVIDQGHCTGEAECPVVIHISIIDADIDHFGNKHVMGSKRNLLFYDAFNIHR